MFLCTARHLCHGLVMLLLVTATGIMPARGDVVTIFRDHFNSDPTAGPGDGGNNQVDDLLDNQASAGGVGGGFVKNSDTSYGSDYVLREYDTYLRITEDGGNQGIVSNFSFDLTPAGIAKIVVKWNVEAYRHEGGGDRRTFYGLQSSTDNMFWASGEQAIYIELDVQDYAGGDDAARLWLNSVNVASDPIVKAIQPFGNIIAKDDGTGLPEPGQSGTDSGFVLTAEFTPEGFHIYSNDLRVLVDDPQVNLQGTWDATGDYTFDALFGTAALRPAAYIRNSINNQDGLIIYDRIAMVLTVPSPTSMSMMAVMTLLTFARRRGQFRHNAMA